jgi:hypothetical protein
MEGLPQLLHDPGAIWMPGKVPVQNAPLVMRDDEEAVKNAKGQHCTVKNFIAPMASR